MPQNTAAYIEAAKAHPFEIRSAPTGEPGENQILVKNHAVAINPIDYKMQTVGVFLTEYPAVLGQDVAGEVVAVGSSVTDFKTGDRVLGLSAGLITGKSTDKAFQQYTILETKLSSKIPDAITFEKASVLPLAITTAAAGLYNPDALNLQVPTQPAQAQSGKVVFISGGASSVGSAAIQLAVASGYEVLTTASKKNFELVQKLGASKVFDYNNASVADDIVSALQGKTLAGAFDAVGGSGWDLTLKAGQAGGIKFVATAARGFPEPPSGIEMKQVFSLSIMKNSVSKAVWEDYVPKALEAGTLVPFPEPWVIGQGLESIQSGVDKFKTGVSAQKVVVQL